MRLVHCACDTDFTLVGTVGADGTGGAVSVEEHRLPAIPSRKDLRFLDEVARVVLPVDPTPSLQEIAASPSVSHLGEPAFAPQQPDEPLRVIVSGTDAALSAVLTRMMRADYLWAEVAYLPMDPTSPASVLWGLAELSDSERLALAVSGPVRPIPCIRNDSGVVVAGSAMLQHVDDAPYFGEIVVDNTVLIRGTGEPARRGAVTPYGARLVPTVSAPGLAAAAIVGPAEPPARRFPRFWGGREFVPSPLDPTHTPTGRALQSGGQGILVTVDGVAAKRPVERVTFYRHLRDIQAVRG